MLTIQGLFDGKKFIALEKLPSKKKSKVLITFIDEVDETQEIRNLSSQLDAFTFWGNEEEDIYQDYLPENKK